MDSLNPKLYAIQREVKNVHSQKRKIKGTQIEFLLLFFLNKYFVFDGLTCFVKHF